MKKQASLFNFFKKPDDTQSDLTKPSSTNKNPFASSNNLSSSNTNTKMSIEKLESDTTPTKSFIEDDIIAKNLNAFKKLKKDSKAPAANKKQTKENSRASQAASKSQSKTEKATPTADDPEDDFPESEHNNPHTKITDADFDSTLREEDSPSKSNNTLQPQGRRQWVSKRRGRVLTRQGPEEVEGVWVDLSKVEDKKFNYNYFFDATPEWARKEYARDSEGRYSIEEGYDPTTLYIPPGALDSLTPAMKQYWRLKSKNYDKILLFKVGKFFEIYYDDALTCHEELGLRWRGYRMETNFPDISLEKWAYKLVSKGYKVCVVDQIETPRQMEIRSKEEKIKHKDRIIKREPVQILSRGTYIDYRDNNYESKTLLSLRHRPYQDKLLFGVAFLDVGSNTISMGYFYDDENNTMFKTFINQIRPAEVVYEPLDTNPELIKMLRSLPSFPSFSPLSKAKDWNPFNAYNCLEDYYGEKEKWPETIQAVMEMDDTIKDLILSSMSGIVQYLKQMLIADNVFQTARYQMYDIETYQNSRMVLDSQALQHLEITEVSYNLSGSVREKGSLLSYIDHTVTKFGKRLLKKWICAPLLDTEAINDRLDAVEDLNLDHSAKEKFLKEMKQLIDLERMCGRIYNLSAKTNENVFMFEEIGKSRLQDFKKLLENLRKARNAVLAFKNSEFKSKLLKRLTSLDENYEENSSNNSVPDIAPLLKIFNDYILWEGPNQEKPVPKRGIQPEYDIAKDKLSAIEEELQEHMREIQKVFKSKDLIFANVKHRYEIEIPTNLLSMYKKPDDFEFSSKKAGKERYITPRIKELVPKLEVAEEELRIALNIFIWTVFRRFHGYYHVWDKFIEALAQLDCLCSLSTASFQSDGIMCRPEVHPASDSPFLEVKEMRHPCICMVKSNFIANDIIVGDPTQESHEKYVILVTGPNMGGKSTILRQSCIAVVLAQIGCYVPAESCRLSVVDRIFTRIGASDNLCEGKSTFFIEMEETVNVLKYGTRNSLVIMDELGRGTSTFDGVSLAYSVLNYLISKMKCRTFFATHYHVLLEEFKDNKDIAFYHMASKVDEAAEKVIFLYKFMKGGCVNSFGLNIARLSGLPKSVVEQAKGIAKDFEENLNIQEFVKTNKMFNNIVNILSAEGEEQNVEENLNKLDILLQSFNKVNYS